MYNKAPTNEITKVLRETFLTSTAAFYWYPLNDESFIKQGTIFFVNTGKRLIAITNHHVYDAYIKDISNNQSIICQIGTSKYSGFKPKERLIDSYKYLDIATFDIVLKDLEELKKQPINGSQSKWPPTPPKRNQGIFSIGFPGQERLVDTKKGVIEWGYIYLLGIAETVNEQKISVQLKPEYRDKISTMPYHYNMQGISGSPLIVLEMQPVFSYRLGGIIYESNSDLGLIFASPINCINVDGSINRLF